MPLYVVLIHMQAFGVLKQACAKVNTEFGLDAKKADAIIQAARVRSWFS